MQPIVLPSIKTNRDSWHSQEGSAVEKAIRPVIQLAAIQSNTQGAYVYHFAPTSHWAQLCVFIGRSPFKDSANALADPKLNSTAIGFHRGRRTPLVLHEDASADWRFIELPEFQGSHFHGVVSVPLIDADVVVGIANFCREERSPFKPRELAVLFGLNFALATLLRTSSLREELQKTAQLLSDRKILDRAKGLLQETLSVTEEQAYLHIRRLSRQQRSPMRQIATQLIQACERHVEG